MVFSPKYWLVVAFLLVATSCSSVPTLRSVGTNTASAPTASVTDESSQASAAGFDEASYCETLSEMIAQQPEGEVASEESEAYADLIESAAAIAPAEHQEPLLLIAEMNRAPEDMDIEDFGEAMRVMPPILKFANDRCGVAFPGTTFNEDGTISITGGGEATSSFSINEGGDELNSDDGEASDEGPTAFIPSDAGTTPPRALYDAVPPEEVAAAINASVPGDQDLTFEWLTVFEEDDPDFPMRILAPVGWEQDIDSFGVEFSAPGGIFTDYEVGSGCQGICLAQEWIEVMDDPESSPFAITTSSEINVVLRQELSNPPGRLLVYQRVGGLTDTVIELARWSNDADKFFQCEASLEEEYESLWPAFADACIAGVAEWIN